MIQDTKHKLKTVRTLKALIFGIEKGTIAVDRVMVSCQSADSLFELGSAKFDVVFECEGDISDLPQ
jgi:hypothetical protein